MTPAPTASGACSAVSGAAAIRAPSMAAGAGSAFDAPTPWLAQIWQMTPSAAGFLSQSPRNGRPHRAQWPALPFLLVSSAGIPASIGRVLSVVTRIGRPHFPQTLSMPQAVSDT